MRKHKTGTIVAIVSTLLIQVGCTGTSPRQNQAEPHVRAETILGVRGGIPELAYYSQAEGTLLPAGAKAIAQTDGRLLKSPVVRAYQLGRYVDPEDSRLMHEAHVVYRIEEDAVWSLDTEPEAAPGKKGPEKDSTPQE